VGIYQVSVYLYPASKSNIFLTIPLTVGRAVLVYEWQRNSRRNRFVQLIEIAAPTVSLAGFF